MSGAFEACGSKRQTTCIAANRDFALADIRAQP
jgi:hypothetical protein